jgi:isopenicillin N synthase-like dioxygenase
MSDSNIPVVDLADLRAGGERRSTFVRTIGDALAEVGFFAVRNHGVDQAVIDDAYGHAQAFFALPEEVKLRYFDAAKKGQRGFTPFGREHAKDVAAPDLKEFWQVGRTDVPDNHPVHALYGGNPWPDAAVPGFSSAMTRLYESLDGLGREVLVLCAEYLEESPDWFEDAAHEGDTILRVIHYPPVGEDAPAESVRAAAHEDINLITLLCGATSDGLELLQRDGSWLPVKARHDEIVIDSGDMIQNVTNGRLRATTHRVIRPASERAGEERFSMPCFIHPRRDVDLTPLPGCVEKTGGERRFDAMSAGEYLDRRLAEIGIG